MRAEKTTLPDRIEDVERLEDLLSEPSPGAVEAMGRLEGDLVLLGVGGKMGPTLAWMARRAFDAAIRTEGKRICSKYINEPVTTPYAIMFLPTEGLYAEVLRRAITDPAYVGDIDWADRSIEVVETAEQALVSKTARVVEEISLKKVGTEHIETVHEKLRRQQAEIVRVDASGKPIASPRP